jgi:hypothetical protein
MTASDRLEESLVRVARAAQDLVLAAKTEGRYIASRGIQEVPIDVLCDLEEEVKKWKRASEDFLSEMGR